MLRIPCDFCFYSFPPSWQDNKKVLMNNVINNTVIPIYNEKKNKK